MAEESYSTDSYKEMLLVEDQCFKILRFAQEDKLKVCRDE